MDETVKLVLNIPDGLLCTKVFKHKINKVIIFTWKC